MPSKNPGKKQYTKSKSTPSVDINLDKSVTGYTSLLNDVKGAEGWYPVVYTICNVMSIPDLSSRRGLKKIHKNFADITRKLDEIYAVDGASDDVAQAVLAIYTRMCADSLLKDRLIKESGLLSHAFALLNRPACVLVALQALCAVTHIGGREARLQFAKRASSLLKLLEDHPTNKDCAELSLVVLSHSATEVMGVKFTPDGKLVNLLELPRLIQLSLREMMKPTASALLMSHIIPMLATIPEHSYKDVKAHSSAINFLIAFSTASDILTRSDAILGIMRLFSHQHDDSTPVVDPHNIISAATSWPDHLAESLFSYGWTRMDTYKTLRAYSVFQKALFKVVQDQDFYTMGRTIGPLILEVEHSVMNGTFEVQDPCTGRRESGEDLGLPFNYWIDALPIAAAALRAKGNTEDDVLANYLEFKYMIVARKLSDPGSTEKIKQAIEQNPRNGYCHYVLSLFPENDRECLRATKKGLSCPNLTDFLRCSLLYQSVSLAAKIGLNTLQLSQDACNGRREEGVAIMIIAFEDAKAFLDCAFPDNRNLTNAIDWYIILAFVLSGVVISVDMKGLKNVLDKLKIAEDYLRRLNMPIKRTQARPTRKELVNRLPTAIKEWGAVVRRYSEIVNEEEEKVCEPLKKAEEDLMAWLDSFQDDDEDERSSRHRHETYVTHPKVNPNMVELYSCSWCRNPSAVLRKCSGCEKARYCDTRCQNTHWKTHRNVCGRGIERKAAESKVEKVQREVSSVDAHQKEPFVHREQQGISPADGTMGKISLDELATLAASLD